MQEETAGYGYTVVPGQGYPKQGTMTGPIWSDMFLGVSMYSATTATA
jgi:hypothetical protein